MGVQRPRLVYSGINCQFNVLFGSKGGPTSSRGGGGGGGGGGAGQYLTEKYFVNFLVLKLIYSGFNVLDLFTVGSTVNLMYFLVQKGVQHLPGVGVKLNCLIPIELVIFKVSSGHLPPPPPPPKTSSLGLCMTDPSQNDRVSCLNHELC